MVWPRLPSIRAGINANHHEDCIQEVAGVVISTNRSSIYGGFGANAVGAESPAVLGLVANFHLADAIYQPRIAGHHASSRRFAVTAARNDTLRDAAVAYLELLRSRTTFLRGLRGFARQLASISPGLLRAGERSTSCCTPHLLRFQ